MRPLSLAAASWLALVAGTALANDPINILTREDDVARVIRETPPAVVVRKVAEVPPAKTDAQPSGGPSKVELAAIYYYAEQRQEDRVKAEYARLRHKYPDFEMPKDLYKPKVERLDERLLWALYDKDDITGIDEEIARRVAQTPGWVPSDDFAAKFARKKMRLTIKAAHDAKDWPSVIAAGAALDPGTEKEVDLLWSMIDAYSGVANKPELGRFYRAILFRDKAHEFPKKVIIATIQKATRDFAPADIRAVMARYAADPEISAGLAGISVDLIRKTVADFNVDKNRTAPLPKADIDALIAAAASAEGRVDDFSLLGWYDLKVKDPAEASAWFRRALEKEPNAEHAKGLYLSLVQQDRQEEAYDLALKYKAELAADPVFLMNALAERFAKPETGKVDAEAVKAYSATILATKSAAHAEILAWYAYNSGQYPAAKAWFGKSFAWEPAATRLKGLALAQGQLGDRTALVALYERYSSKYPDIWDDVHLNKNGKTRTVRRKAAEIDAMEVGAVEKQAKATPEFLEEAAEPAPRPRRRTTASETTTGAAISSGADGLLSASRYGDCIAALQRSEAKGRLSPAASLTKGWCLMGLKRTAEAKDAFAAALAGSGKTRADAAYGMALTLLRGSLTDEAEAVISLYPLTPARDKEIRLAIYWQKARSAFDNKQYQRTLDALNARIALTPEPTDMTQLRAWAHFNLGHVAEARAIFQKLSAYIDDAGVRRGLAATGMSTSKVR
jgi:tetratricopeptide (TPR) repeat protein